MTLPFIGGSSNIDKVQHRYVIHMCTKNLIDRTNGLGGVREQTYIHTYRHTDTLREIRIWIIRSEHDDSSCLLRLIHVATYLHGICVVAMTSELLTRSW